MKIGTKFTANKFWNDIIFQVQSSDGDELPTVDTTSLEMHFNASATVVGNVTSEGSSSVTSKGFVWATHDNPTLTDHVDAVSSGLGSFTNLLGGLPFPATVYFAAYATNSSGTSYGTVLHGDVQICFAEGTLVTMYDSRKKKIEDIRYTDDLLVWNFDEGMADKAKPVWMVQPFKANYYGLLTFSNGQQLKTVADGRGHRIFNIEKSMFTYSMCEDTPIGTTTVTENNEVVRLIEKQIVRKDTMFYNVVTHTHFNIYANDILTSTGLNNIYRIEEMRFVKDGRVPTARDDFAEVSDGLFVGLRLAEQPIRFRDKIKMMVARQWMVLKLG